MKTGGKLGLILLLAFSCCSVLAAPKSMKSLSLRAEDLWGGEIDLSAHRKGLFLIHPFSPANCGYCLIDGEFFRENYRRYTEEAGGAYVEMCLFNPQLDIQAYQKHYRDETTVLTAPLDLHDLHRDGFPYLIAFKNGEAAYSDVSYPYGKVFYNLRSSLWPGVKAPLRPVSSWQMATRFIFENMDEAAVVVCPDGDDRYFRSTVQMCENVRESVIVKTESQLNEGDWRKNLFFRGVCGKFRFERLRDATLPFTISPKRISIGDAVFDPAGIGFSACCPNPLNPERYLLFSLTGEKVRRGIEENWVDYSVYRDDGQGGTEVLLHGLFAKDDPGWRYDPALAAGSAKQTGCEGGICPAPFFAAPDEEKQRDLPSQAYDYFDAAAGRQWTLGGADCRFPSLAAGEDGRVWTAWEERGDIFLAALGEAKEIMPVEAGFPDSYNPVLAADGDEIWVFYLSLRDGFYRLYGKCLSGGELSEEVLFSAPEPCDAITPAAAGNGRGTIVLAWSDWQANQRFVRYRVIGERVPGPIQTARIAPSEIDYTNAWWPSLAVDVKGRIYGAWNQHYPLTLCVCAGDLENQAAPATKNPAGYPAMALDSQGTPWVFWESFAWDLYAGKPQQILGARYDSAKKAWSLPVTLSRKAQSTMNQTPKTAVGKDGRIWVVWSGRKSERDAWRIYLTCCDKGRWREPIPLTDEKSNARAPVIAVDGAGVPWIAWHEGRGAGMRIRVLRVD